MAKTETLSKFGVGIDGVRHREKAVRPLYRWRALFTNFGLDTSTTDSVVLSAELKKCGTPHRSFGRKEVHAYNSVAYHAGKPTWEEIEMTAYDTYDNSVEKAVASQMSKQFSAINQTSATVPSNYKFTTDIEVLDGADNKTFSYYLEGCYVTDYSTDEFDYSSDEDQTLKIKLSFDNCTLYDENDNVIDQANESSFLNNILNL